MTTVYLINEENHGTIGVSDSVGSAIIFLIQKNWIAPLSEIILGEDEALPLWRHLGFTTKKSCGVREILQHFLSLSEKETIEELEKLGFYLYDYELIE